MSFSLEELNKTALLAYLDPKDVSPLLVSCDSILTHIKTLQKIDLTDITPQTPPIDAVQPLRSDDVHHNSSPGMLANAATVFVDDLYIVPQMIKNEV